MYYICHGPFKERTSMLSCDYWLPEEMYAKQAALLNDGVPLCLEYDSYRYTPIYNEHELALACRIVCNWHNENSNQFDDDGWIKDTARIWEKMIFTIPCDEEAYDESYDEYYDHEEVET